MTLKQGFNVADSIYFCLITGTSVSPSPPFIELICVVKVGFGDISPSVDSDGNRSRGTLVPPHEANLVCYQLVSTSVSSTA